MIPIYKPYMPEGIMPGVEKILYSGQLAFGTYGRLFERSLSTYVGNEKLIAVSSYNHAMLIALSTLCLRPGDEIIASPVSCLASNQPFASKYIKVIWADVNPQTGTLCPDDVKARITNKTKAIFHNHFCGFLGEIDEIRKIGISYGVPVVDDCIEAFGSEYHGQKAGNQSDISIFSFQTVRIPNTIEGGAITFKDQKLFEKAKKVRDYGIDRSKFRNSLGEISAECDIDVEGYGGMMSEMNAYIGAEQMKSVESLLSKQRSNAKKWNSMIEELRGIEPIKLTANTEPNYWVYGVLCEDKHSSLKFFREKGWYATGVHINNNIYSVFDNNTDLPGVNEFIRKYLAIPCGWWVDFNELGW